MNNENVCVVMGDFSLALMEEYAVLLDMVEGALGMSEILDAHHPELCWAEKPYYYMVALCGEVKEYWNSCSIREGGFLEFDCSPGACWIEPLPHDEFEGEDIWGIAKCGDSEYWEWWEMGFNRPGFTAPRPPRELLPF